MVELFTARSGAPSMKVDGVAMHSPYDPEREAERFLQETIGAERPSTVIVLGECVGHLARAVSRRLPAALVLAALYSVEIAAASAREGLPFWSPASGTSFAEFLRRHLGELQIEGLRVLEWPPSARAFPVVSRAANEAVRQVVQELNGGFVTTVAAGRLWLRNCVANLVNIPQVLSGPLCPERRPVVVAASGPSLEEALPLLRELRAHAELWALPSSCPALAHAGLAPDLVVLTDPGYYAMHHLHFAAPRCPVAMPLSAARGAWGLPSRPGILLLEQPFPLERRFLDAARVAAPRVPPHGTVAATAIGLALGATRGPIVLAGLDLAERDLLSHARPNAFDSLLHLQSTRLTPHASLLFRRAIDLGSTTQAPGVRLTPALRTYAGWLGGGFAAESGRLFRLFPSRVAIPGMGELDRQSARGLLREFEPGHHPPALLPSGEYPPPAERRRAAGRILQAFSREAERATEALQGAPQASWDPGRFPRAVELAYLVTPRQLVDSLRKSRLGEREAARSAAIELFAECRRFLESLAGRLRG